MSGAQFTPGPWEARSQPWATGHLWLVGRKEHGCEHTLVRVFQPFGRPTGTSEANARLIAAAPELYDACVDTLDALNRLRDGFELSPRNTVRDAALLMIDQHVDLLETALFKARGDHA